MMWLPDGEQIEDMFIRFDLIHERDRHPDGRTDGQTDRHSTTAKAALMHSIAWQKSINADDLFSHAIAGKRGCLD